MTAVDPRTDVAVRPVRNDSEMEQALALRHDVFVVEQGVPKRDELDGRDGRALHIVAVDRKGVVLGCVRLLVEERVAQLTRLAVHPDARRQGLGGRLVEACEREARNLEARRIALHAQTYAMELYRQHGFRVRGRRFHEAGIEHQAMEKRL